MALLRFIQPSALRRLVASRDVRRRDVYRGALRVAPDVRDVLHCALRDVLHCAAHAVVQLQFPRSSPLRRYPKRSRTQCVQRVGARDKSNVTVASYQSDSQDEKLGRLRPNAEPWAPAGARPRTEAVEDLRSSAERVHRDRLESVGGARQAC